MKRTRVVRALTGSAARPALALGALLATVPPVMTACVLTPEQRDERTYRRIHFEERFADFRQRCWARGGRVVIDAKQGLGRGDMPHRGDRYFCA